MTSPHASDPILDDLAQRILSGALPAGARLPSEQSLADEHGVSRIIVRQAVHRLADAGLVSVQRGGRPTVLSASNAQIGVLELLGRVAARLGVKENPWRRDLVEYVELYGVMILELAQRRATSDSYQGLDSLLQATPVFPSQQQIAELESQFWLVLAQLGNNRVLRLEVEHWHRLGASVADGDGENTESPTALRFFYAELLRQLKAKQDVIPYFLATIRA